MRSVDGWLQPGAASLIECIANTQRDQGITGHVAEIGVHEGKLLILLCLVRNEQENAIAIDVFEQQSLNTDRSGHGDRERLEKNIRRYLRDGIPPILLPADSRKLTSEDLQRLVSGKFRLFSIDGGHEADTVAHDLELAASCLCEGGVIVLDDFFNEGWPGVADGTLDFINLGKFPELVPFAVAQNKVFFSTRSHVDVYRHSITTALQKEVRIRNSTLFRHPVTYFDFRFSRFSLFIFRSIQSFDEKFPRALRILRRLRESFGAI